MNRLFKKILILAMLIGLSSFVRSQEAIPKKDESQKAWEEKLQKIREAGERRKLMIETTDDPFQLRGLSVGELYRQAELNRYPDPYASDKFEAILEELKKSPEELRSVVDKRLMENFDSEKDRFAVDKFFSIPYIARAGGKEFQVETIKKLFDHPRMTKDMAEGLIQVSGLMEIVASSEKDQSGFLDHLIEKGYVERGSETEANWRKELSNKQPSKSHSGSPHSDMQSTGTEDQSSTMTPSHEQHPTVWPYYLVGSIFIVGIGSWLFLKKK